MPIGYDIFNTVRLNAVMNALIDPRQLPGQFEFSRRVPTVRATDNEITARFVQYPQVADLIADDQRAVVYTTGKFQLSTSRVPNLKIGANMTQTALNQLLMINSNPGVADVDFFRDWESNTIFNLRLGLQQRVELLNIAMMCDSFVYDRLGLKVNASWGMPSDLKVTPATAWDNIAATPISDILTARRLAQVKYGRIFNRLTMSLAAFNYMTATTEFQNRAKAFLPVGMALGVNYPTEATDDMLRLAERIFGNGIRIVLYDAMYWSQNELGVTSMFSFLPITKVIFDSSANDNNRQVWDLANTQVTEALVASLNGRPIAAQNAVGPLTYTTSVENLNPPQITYWSVQRCFPRKHDLYSNMVFTVGSFSDPIPSVVPF